MSTKLKIALLSLAIFAASCSSVPVPSVPWFSSPPKVDPTAEALYEEGMRAFNEKKYIRAIDNFSKIKTDYPFSPLLTQAELMTADAYYLNEQYPEAISAFKEFQSLHPTGEQIPFVILRLGQSHFDQFTAVDRDQKNTEIAKGYFETLITTYPKSPQAAVAREKLAKAVEYLAEHEFSAAQFYFQQQKYPAARDRFEEIVRKYKDTPTAVKSLFFLGECYRIEKNGPRATLAYEALIQRYPMSPYAFEARTQLALVEKEKIDPLDLLLMRDRRPGAATIPEVKEDPALAKLKDLNLVAKKEVVHEEPGDDKGFFRRVADKINPFSSSGSDKKEKEEDKSESPTELLAKRNQAQKQESGGILSSLWPFGSKETKQPTKGVDGKSGALVAGVDESLKQKGIDTETRQAALKPPAADLPKIEPAAPRSDTVALLGSIDSNLKNRGANANELPPPPQAAEVFKNGVAQEIVAKAATAANQPPQDVQTSGILSAIDQKLKAKGVEPAKFEQPPTPAQVEESARARPKPVELEPKLALEKGPLFLNPGEVQIPQPSALVKETDQQSAPQPNTETVLDSLSRPLVKGPVQTQQVASRPLEAKKPVPGQEDEPKGVFDQLRQDMENASKLLNPFRW